MAALPNLSKFKVRLLASPTIYWMIKPYLLGLWSVFAPPKKNRLSLGFERNFIFIIGSGRSGNTLLRRLLMERYDVYIPPETYVLPRIADYAILGRSLDWCSYVELIVGALEYHAEFETFNISSLRDFALQAKGWSKVNQTTPNLIRELYMWLAEGAGLKSAWVGDKTPLNTLYLGRICHVVPNAKYIYLLRDGVDVSVSYKVAGIYDSLLEGARRWLKSDNSWEAFRSTLNRSEYIEIKYENLVADPDNSVRQIGSKFDIPPRKYKSIKKEELGDVCFRMHHANVVNDPNIDSIGKGRIALSNHDASELKLILNAALKKHGYEEIE